MIKIEDQIAFYSEELKELEFSIKKTFSATALTLFQAGELYVGQFKGVDQKRGNVFIDIPNGEGYHSPRLDQKMTCFTLKSGQERPTLWGDLTFSDLLNNRNRVETKIVDYMPSKRDGWIRLIIRGVDVKFLDLLSFNQILALGPTIPPYEYLENLLKLTKKCPQNINKKWVDILLFNTTLHYNRQPDLVSENINISDKIIQDITDTDVLIFQGPPGTGKTYQMADLVTRLVKADNSVLLTALTNKATVEVCEKTSLLRLLKENRVSKIALSYDESIAHPNLSTALDLTPVKGHLKLATYYQFSKIWQGFENIFDYIIIEEASQAYLTTLAAAVKMSKQVIVVGDPMQIVPIVTNRNYQKINSVNLLVNGLSTLSMLKEFGYKRKVDSRRLTSRAVRYTNSFYDNTMVSISPDVNINLVKLKLDWFSKYIHNEGGPTLIEFSNIHHVLDDMIEFVENSLNILLRIKKVKIAVLTSNVDTLKILQKKIKAKVKSKRCIIETVDRVQGLDVDYCFYLIPITSLFSFNKNRFNVATSRSKVATIIMVEKDFDRKVIFDIDVFNYITMLKKEFCFYK